MSEIVYLVAAVVLMLLVGLGGLLIPERIWYYTARLESDGAKAPSDTYVRRMRGGGACFVVFAVAILIVGVTA